MAAIILERVVVSYPSQLQPALGPLDLTIQEGECVFVTGPNGSGKTTLARMLSGVIHPTAGHVTNGEGLDITEWPPGYIGWVQQNPLTQMVGTTVSEDVSLGPRWLSATLAQVVHQTAGAIDRFHLGPLRNHTIHTLSGGWQHQVALAAVWAQDPRVIILDEPETMLDGPAMQRLMTWIQNLRDTGTTLMILGHNPRWLAVADRTVVLDHGVWVKDSLPTTDKDREWDRFLTGLFGDGYRPESIDEVSEWIWPGKSAR